MFPDATILLLVRRPLEHARSLLRQHHNFLEMHKETPFVRRYMADLGHYEFGDVHRPIRFPGLGALTANRGPLTIDYWLGYWIAAFEHVLRHRDKVMIVSYEDTCADAPRALAAICARLEIADEGLLPKVAALPKGAARAGSREIEADRGLRERAERVYRALNGQVY